MTFGRRTRFALVLATLSASSMAVSLACGPPDSFDNLTGAPPEDSGAPPITIVDGSPTALAAPRLKSPLSGTWTSGSRPLLRWALEPGALGASIELCRSRDCNGARTLEASGEELAPPADLEPGIWFWRARATAPGVVGADYSATWMFLVRGGGQNSAPGGLVFDVNGDGRADLLVAVEYFPGTWDAIALPALNDDSTDFALVTSTGDPIFGGFISRGDAPINGIDVDGDGYADVVTTDDTDRGDALAVTSGSPDGLVRDRNDSPLVPIVGPASRLAAAGDIDGDGYGDVTLATTSTSYIAYGSKAGIADLQVLTSSFPDGGIVSAVGAGFGRNADPFAEVAYGNELPDSSTPFTLLYGGQRAAYGYAVPAITGRVFDRPQRFVAGDFDGDGLSDLAVLAVVDGTLSLCAMLATAPEDGATVTCHAAPAPPAGYGDSLAAADLDADGKDELLVSSQSAGVDIVSFAASPPTVEHVDGPYGVSVTVIVPGRPGPAVWAATIADGTGIAIHRGKDRVNTLAPPPVATKYGTSIR